MAIFTAIPEKTQTAAAMKRVINYVMQDKKTVYEDDDGNRQKLVSGQNCVAESAYHEFMATKRRFHKTNGVYFKQYVQSFQPDCGATPEMIHQIGMEMAEAFEGFEVVVATHIDRDHWHNHFVVNSVNSETGLKIQINEKGLEELRRKSDEICMKYGLEVLAPYQKPKERTMNGREYHAAIRGKSQKLRLMNAIDLAVARSRSKKRFIEEMKKLGYGVKWIDRYKYITYTTPEGLRIRDNRLFEEKYLKTNMEGLFAYEYIRTQDDESDRGYLRIRDAGRIRGTEQVTGTDRGNGGRDSRADPTDIPDAEAGAVQSAGEIYRSNWERHCREHGFDIRIADSEGFSQTERYAGYTDVQSEKQCGQRHTLDEIFNRAENIRTDTEYQQDADSKTGGTESGAEGAGYEPVEDANEMGADWSDTAALGISLAADVAAVAGGKSNEEPEQKRPIRERKHGRKKKKQDQEPEEQGSIMTM